MRRVGLYTCRDLNNHREEDTSQDKRRKNVRLNSEEQFTTANIGEIKQEEVLSCAQCNVATTKKNTSSNQYEQRNEEDIREQYYSPLMRDQKRNEKRRKPSLRQVKKRSEEKRRRVLLCKIEKGY